MKPQNQEGQLKEAHHDDRPHSERDLGGGGPFRSIIAKVLSLVSRTSRSVLAVILISAIGLLCLITMLTVCGALGRGPVCNRGGASSATQSDSQNPTRLQALAQTWSNWSPCSGTCGAGYQVRLRLQGADSGAQTETKDCWHADSCKGSSGSAGQQFGWLSWSEWTRCSVTCGSGRLTRTRNSRCPAGLSAGNCTRSSETEAQFRDCSEAKCPTVDGSWSHWIPWSSCHVTCGWGMKVRKRLCNNPSQSGDGKHCEGLSEDADRCMGGNCPVEGQWGPWSPCSELFGGSGCKTVPPVQCREGKRFHCRNCDNPKPQFGGSACITGLASVTRDCWNTEACDGNLLQPPMNFGIVGFLNSSNLLITWRRAPYGLTASSFFLAWAVAGTDSRGDADIPAVPQSQQETLGESYQHWIRNLTPGSELHVSIATRSNAGGVAKVSAALQQSFRVSRVDGGWGEWSSYGACSPTADCNIPGRHSRTRKCDSPSPTNGGLPCDGSPTETSRCFHMC